MQTAFELAHAFTAEWEGGFVNHPKDPGGATNYGVSLRWLKEEGIDLDFQLSFPIDHNGDGVIDILDIKALTPKQAEELFRIAFWDRLRLDDLPTLTAIVTYDAAVNTGRGQAARFLQRACNTFNGEALAVDGAIGPLTRARALQIGMVSDGCLAELCLQERSAFHRMLAANSPYPDGRDYRDFLIGWLNRTSAGHRYIKSMVGEIG